MPLSIDSALGIMPQALQLRSRRAEMLASNLANSETPGYLARDFDFRKALDGAQQNAATLKVTHQRHMQPAGGIAGGAQAQYRVPNQPALDGNTVDPHLEKTAFAENTIQYQATLTFLNGRIKGLRGAIRGE